ncbi:hypothetical protein LINGRAHAP2_LOCUS23197 [Linum grandiflorum]
MAHADWYPTSIAYYRRD